MDIVDYTDAGVRQMKGIRHLSNWQLIIPLLLLTSYTACDMSTPSSVPEVADSNKQPKTPVKCTGETASFTWAYEIQPFFAVEWHFENTQIAWTVEESFSQDDISISPNYADRFHLQTAGNVGFNLTDVTKNDTGNYSCIVTLESTDIPKELTTKNLQVTDSCSQTKPVSCCQGGTASFSWTHDIPPFRSIKWYFENTNLAEASESQDSLIIHKSYTDRFHLHKPGNAGFNLTKVVNDDEGNYRCIITLQSTNITKELDWKLRVKGVTGRRRKRATSGVDEPFSCDADEQPPASDSSTDATIGIVVAACIVVIAVVVVIVIKRKRNSRTEQRSAGPDGNCSEETGPESHKLVVHEDQTRQPDKQTCEQMNLTQAC